MNNKLKIAVIALVVIFLAAVMGSHFIDRNNKANNTKYTRGSDNSADSSIAMHELKGKGNGQIYTELEVTEKEIAVKPSDISKIGSSTYVSANLEVKASLSDEEWNERIDAGLTEDNIKKAMSQSAGLYCFNKLDAFGKQVYAEIYLSLMSYSGGVWLCSISPEEIDLAFNCVMNDHPEIYFSNGYLYTKYTNGDEIVKILFNPTYTVSKDDIETYNEYIEEYYQAYKKQIPSGASEYDKIKYTYEFVIINTEYDIDSPENQNILSVCLMGKSVCQGYAKTFQYLLNREKIDCTLVTGTVGQNEGHAWNLVSCNGSYYYVDCTWGDASYTHSSETANSMGKINFDYLNITTKEIEKTHSIDNCVELPVCKASSANYYVKENLFFETLDTNQILNAFIKASNENRSSVELKCANNAVYEQMGQYLLDESHIFDYLDSSVEKATYVQNSDLLIYSFSIVN